MESVYDWYMGRLFNNVKVPRDETLWGDVGFKLVKTSFPPAYSACITVHNFNALSLYCDPTVNTKQGLIHSITVEPLY